MRGAPKPPTWLDKEGKAEWNRVVPELDAIGLLAQVDRAIVTLYCDAWSKFMRIAREMNEVGSMAVPDEGHAAKGSQGIKKHPLWQMYREAGQLCAAHGAKIGLNPHDRQRLKAQEREDDDDILD